MPGEDSLGRTSPRPAGPSPEQLPLREPGSARHSPKCQSRFSPLSSENAWGRAAPRPRWQEGPGSCLASRLFPVTHGLVRGRHLLPKEVQQLTISRNKGVQLQRAVSVPSRQLLTQPCCKSPALLGQEGRPGGAHLRGQSGPVEKYKPPACA